MSVDIGGYWGGWEGGVVVEPGWGSVPIGSGIDYGGGYGRYVESDTRAAIIDWGPGVDWETGGKEPPGREFPVPLPRPGECNYPCVRGTPCPPNMLCAQVLRCVCPWDPGWRYLQPQDGHQPPGGQQPPEQDPLRRVGDVIERVLAGGGGGIVIPQLPQPQAVVAPTTERRVNPAALVLLVAGLGLGAWYVYQRTRRS